MAELQAYLNEQMARHNNFVLDVLAQAEVMRGRDWSRASVETKTPTG